MGKTSRRKGKDAENWLARQLRPAYPSDVTIKRGLQSRDGGEVPDVDAPLIWWEMKHGKKPNPRAALAQAIEATDGRLPVAVIKDDRKDAFAVLRFDDLRALIHTLTRLSCDPEGAIEASRQALAEQEQSK